MWKRFISILVLLCLSCLLFAQQPQSTTQENLTKIDDYLVNVENNLLMQQIQIENLEQSLKDAEALQENLQIQLTEVSNQLGIAEKYSKKLEFQCKALKVSLAVGIPTAIIGTMIIYSALNK